MKNRLRLSLLMLLVISAPAVQAQTFAVIHKNRLGRDGHGTITISPDSISYQSSRKKHSRTWRYPDIQYFDRISRKKFAILTYQDQRLLLGRDREYHFVITNGELTDDVFEQIQARLNKPVTDRVVPANVQAQYSIPVKHLHRFGGCQGTLMFTSDRIYYAANDKAHVRDWLISRDVDSVWSANPYELEIRAYDNNRREFSRTAAYRFALKQPLDQSFYRRLELTLYGLRERAKSPDSSQAR